MVPVLEVRALSAGCVAPPLLSEISFTANACECIGILGPNGSGKTTLLKTIAGVLAPHAGEIRVKGRALGTVSVRERARLLAVLPQRPRIPPGIRVRDFVLLGRYAHASFLGFRTRRDYAVVDRVLRRTDTFVFRDRLLASLSGGEIQRVLLALALAQESPLLLVDELGSGLDAKARISLYSLLLEEVRAGATVLFVEHDYNIARVVATRLLGLSRGRLLFNAVPDDVFTDETLSQLYDLPITVLRPPGTRARLACPRFCL